VALSYWMGQKIYPIAYPLKRMGFHAAPGFRLYAIYLFLHRQILEGRIFLSLSVATGLFLVFVLVVVVKEKIRIPFLK